MKKSRDSWNASCDGQHSQPLLCMRFYFWAQNWHLPTQALFLCHRHVWSWTWLALLLWSHGGIRSSNVERFTVGYSPPAAPRDFSGIDHGTSVKYTCDIYIYIYLFIHACMYVYVYVSWFINKLHVYMYTYIHTFIHTYIRRNLYTYIHTYIHT